MTSNSKENNSLFIAVVAPSQRPTVSSLFVSCKRCNIEGAILEAWRWKKWSIKSTAGRPFDLAWPTHKITNKKHVTTEGTSGCDHMEQKTSREWDRRGRPGPTNEPNILAGKPLVHEAATTFTWKNIIKIVIQNFKLIKVKWNYQYLHKKPLRKCSF